MGWAWPLPSSPIWDYKAIHHPRDVPCSRRSTWSIPRRGVQWGSGCTEGCDVPEPQPVRGAGAFWLAVAVLTLAALHPIWTNRFLPMQDLPFRLFIAHVAATYDDPTLDWHEHFEVMGPIAPYRLSPLLLRVAAAVTDMLTAAQLNLTFYILLIVVAVRHLHTTSPNREAPWGALVLFPLAFHQMYYYGFLDYVLALPVLLVLLVDLDRFAAAPLELKGSVRQALWMVVLFLLHPFAALLHAVLAGVSAMFFLKDRSAFRRALLPPLAMGALFMIWFLLTQLADGGGDGGAASLGSWRAAWWPFAWNWRFLVLQFTGMKIVAGIDRAALLAWTAVIAIIVSSGVIRRKKMRPPLKLALLVGLVLLAFFALPSRVWAGASNYSFFNGRLAPVAYLLLGWAAARVPLRRYPAYTVAAGCLLLLVLSARQQSQVAREIESIVPVTQKMVRNAAVLPLIVQSRSDALDPFYFAQFHYHEVFYYHILVGGGVNPDLMANQLMLIHYREGKRPPRPPPEEFSRWSDYGQYYDYIVARGLPPPLEQQLLTGCDSLEHAGAWRLFRIRK